MGKYFGTDGFRGKAGEVLTAEHAFRTGRFLGWYYANRHASGTARIVIGKDTRRSSYMYESALAAGITSSGADAYLLHVTTTPCVSFITRTENFDCGVMISAEPQSLLGQRHQAHERRRREDGRRAAGRARSLHRRRSPNSIPWAVEDKIGRTIDFYSGRNRYIGYLIEHRHPLVRRPQGSARLLERQRVDDRPRCVRRARRQDVRHQRQARRRECEPALRLDPH